MLAYKRLHVAYNLAHWAYIQIQRIRLQDSDISFELDVSYAYNTCTYSSLVLNALLFHQRPFSPICRF